jgi:hypothetical protein
MTITKLRPITAFIWYKHIIVKTEGMDMVLQHDITLSNHGASGGEKYLHNTGKYNGVRK